jgi:hypothetical protein
MKHREQHRHRECKHDQLGPVVLSVRVVEESVRSSATVVCNVGIVSFDCDVLEFCEEPVKRSRTKFDMASGEFVRWCSLIAHAHVRYKVDDGV